MATLDDLEKRITILETRMGKLEKKIEKPEALGSLKKVKPGFYLEVHASTRQRRQFCRTQQVRSMSVRWERLDRLAPTNRP